MATFGDRVRTEREERGWSLQQLADRVTKASGITCPRATIEKIESRATEKSKWSAGIAAALEVDHDWLVTGKGSKKITASIDKRLKRLRPEVYDRLHRQINVLIDDEEKHDQRGH